MITLRKAKSVNWRENLILVKSNYEAIKFSDMAVTWDGPLADQVYIKTVIKRDLNS